LRSSTWRRSQRWPKGWSSEAHEQEVALLDRDHVRRLLAHRDESDGDPSRDLRVLPSARVAVSEGDDVVSDGRYLGEPECGNDFCRHARAELRDVQEAHAKLVEDYAKVMARLVELTQAVVDATEDMAMLGLHGVDDQCVACRTRDFLKAALAPSEGI
jgi:hypothetical protein